VICPFIVDPGGKRNPPSPSETNTPSRFPEPDRMIYSSISPARYGSGQNSTIWRAAAGAKKTSRNKKNHDLPIALEFEALSY
jgi:hypothetical protein